VADGVDQDCDELERCWVDADGDGFGTTSFVTTADLTCRDPGLADNADDCDDTNPAISGAGTVWYYDNDGDGSAGDAESFRGCDPPGPDWFGTADDCDDLDATVAPTFAERCDPVDRDCDGRADDVGTPVQRSADGAGPRPV
jgi:hypothetical protein